MSFLFSFRLQNEPKTHDMIAETEHRCRVVVLILIAWTGARPCFPGGGGSTPQPPSSPVNFYPDGGPKDL